MNAWLKWFLAPAVLMAGSVFSGVERAEAAAVRVHVSYPGYHARYVYRHWHPRHHHHAAYYWAPPVHIYRPAPVVVYPRYGYVPVPVYAPYSAPYYRMW